MKLNDYIVDLKSYDTLASSLRSQVAAKSISRTNIQQAANLLAALRQNVGLFTELLEDEAGFIEALQVRSELSEVRFTE